jgi:AraC-like DNA-binding protein
MTASPISLPETPAPAFDVLSDVLRVVRMSGAVFFRADMAGPWAARSVPGRELARALFPSARQLLLFHVVEAGRTWMALDGAEPIACVAGDIVVLPYGDEHTLASDLTLQPVPMRALLEQAMAPGDGVHQIAAGGGSERSRIVCGFLHCDDLLFNPLCRGLPPLIHVRAADEPPGSLLAAMAASLVREASAAEAGTSCLLSRLSELVFVAVLRRHMAMLAPGQVGWVAALADPIVGRALQLLHATPKAPWTVDTLARQVGASRSILADRFRRKVGQPPMQYLASWRLQLAADLLRDGSRGVAAVAAQVGYESEAAFNRAFKRHAGQPPAAWGAAQRSAASSGAAAL